MRDAQKFKEGFLRKIAQMGLLPSDFDTSLQKNANVLNWLKGLGGLAATGGSKSLAIGLGLPAAAGVATGAVARAASQSDDEDLDEVKTEEMASVYRQLAKEVRERTHREREQRGLSIQ